MSMQANVRPRFVQTLPGRREFRMVAQARRQGRGMNQNETQTVITGVLAGLMVVGSFAVLLAQGKLPGEILVLDTTVLSFYFGTFVRSAVQVPPGDKDKDQQ